MEEHSEMKRRMLAGEPYLAKDEQLEADSRRSALLQERYNSTPVAEWEGLPALLREWLADVGEHTFVKPPLFMDYGWNTTIGARTFVNYGAVILDVGPVHIGDDVQIGPNVQLLTPTHPLDATERREGWEAQKPITIGDGVWLGGGVIVCPGVSIGANTVIGAGAVVTKDVPAGVLAAGNPCRVIRVL